MSPEQVIDEATGEIRNAVIPIDRRHLRAVRLFAAEKDIRYYLNGVLVHVLDDGAVRLVATDGHAIAITNTPVGDLFPPTPGKIIIPVDVVKLFAAHKGDTDIAISTLDNKVYKIECVGLSVNFNPIDGSYPEYEVIVPRTVSGEPYQYDPKFLMRFREAAKIYGGKDNCAMTIEYNGEGPALVHTVSQDFIGVVMPWRTALWNGLPAWLKLGKASVVDEQDDDAEQPGLPTIPPAPEKNAEETDEQMAGT